MRKIALSIVYLFLIIENIKTAQNLVKPVNEDFDDFLQSRREDYESNGLDNDGLPLFDNEQPAQPRPYKMPGEWATPAPNSGIDLGFTPVQTYLQVRKTNTVQRLPRSEAIKEAATADEILNAHRLKEVLRTKKIQEVYSEEGYEDSAYDHADHERNAEFDENFAHHKAGKYKVKDPIQHIHDVADAESQVIHKKQSPKKNNKKPKVSSKRVETSNIKVAYMDDDKYINQSKSNARFGRSQSKHKRAPKLTQQQEKEKRPLTVKRDFVSPKDDFWSIPSSFKKYSGNKWSANFDSTHQKKGAKENSDENKRIHIPPIPTFGYIHSLTDAHYGSQAPMAHHLPKPIPSHVINLTETFRPRHAYFPGFEPKRTLKRIKRETKERITSENEQAEEYEKELTKNLDDQKKIIISNALKNLGAVNDIDAEFPILTPPPPRQTFRPAPWKWAGYDTEKYPYFHARDLNPYSPLRYASHPNEFPKKSGYGMEFYEGKDKEMSCDPINFNLSDTDKENSTRHFTEQPGSKKRIVGLGDKIRCLKVKYFGEDPLDSPFFKEDELLKQATNARLEDGLKYHSTYQYKPDKTMDIYVKEKFNDSSAEGTQGGVKYQAISQQAGTDNKTEEFRVIPVEELPEITTAAPIMGMRPPPMKYEYRPLPLSVIRLPRRMKKARLYNTVKYRYNCLHPITKMTISERSDFDQDMIFDCRDVTLVQTMRDGNPHIQIIPKQLGTRRTELIDVVLDDSISVRAGEVIEGSNELFRRRRSAPNTRRKSQLFPNKTLLDKIVKKPIRQSNKIQASTPVDLGDKSPEEVLGLVTTKATEPKKTTTTTTTTQSPLTTQVAIKFEPKPLSRLSGRDFLVRYHKSKSAKSREPVDSRQEEFWQVKATTSLPPTIRSFQTDEQAPPTPQKAELNGQKTTGEEHEHHTQRSKAETNSYRLRNSKTGERSFKKEWNANEKVERSTKTKRDEPGPTPILLYIVNESTGRGQWVREDSTTTESSVSSTPGKKSNRQILNQNARKNFFTKKLNKNL